MPQGGLLISAALSLIIAQLAKIPFHYLTRKCWSLTAALRSGGMPSSHTALMMGLTTACLLQYGWNSPYFAIGAAITSIVMYDAAGVRRQTGEHAVILNEITTTLKTMLAKELTAAAGTIEGRQLKEVLGHKPLEVLGGIVVGILTAVLVYI